MTKINECIYPRRNTCRGCNQSLNPALSDGGCTLYYEGQGDIKSLSQKEIKTVGQPRANFREIQRGSLDISKN